MRKLIIKNIFDYVLTGAANFNLSQNSPSPFLNATASMVSAKDNGLYLVITGQAGNDFINKDLINKYGSSFEIPITIELELIIEKH
jgi:hypothetical protein